MEKQELKDDMFIGFNEAGEQKVFYKLLEFDSKETGKHYLAYTDNEKDEFPAITNAGLASEPITVGKGQYFVLGDNRNNSEDSRHNGMGLVDSDRIVGKLWFTISPWKKIGFV